MNSEIVKCEPPRVTMPGVGKNARALLRTYRILPVLDPSIRERSKTPEFFQVLESWEPSMSQMPLRASEILGF